MVVGGEDDPRGALVRPYAVTRGRTEPTREIAIEAVMLTMRQGVEASRYAGRDWQRIAHLCTDRPQSLAEIAACLRVPLGVARVLVADMITEGILTLHEPLEAGDTQERINVLERVLIGLRNL
ncbi:DUF742 domain-containing protein [Dactylosporangium sp. NPDC049140]|jgi:hypothetical protein|uniref:DUF742 domain-containing protein n=1 Tax=unclassified Dactylosporangium TaxID=2621675 RepID=UPI0033F816FD